MIALRYAIAAAVLSCGYAFCQNDVQRNVDASVNRSLDQSAYRYHFASPDAVVPEYVRRSRQSISPSAMTRSGIQSRPRALNLLPLPEDTPAAAKLTSHAQPSSGLVFSSGSEIPSAGSLHSLSLATPIELPPKQPEGATSRRSGSVIRHFGPQSLQQEKQEMSWRTTHSSEAKHTSCCQ